MTMKISVARVADAAQIARHSRTLIESDLPWSWTQDRIRRSIRHPDTAVIIARDGRRLAGFAIMRFFDAHAHLNLLAVLPAYRDQGLGRELVNWLESCARNAGIFEVRLELRADNDGAQAFYESLGYVESGMSFGYYAGVEDARQMCRDLSVTREQLSGKPHPSVD